MILFEQNLVTDRYVDPDACREAIRKTQDIRTAPSDARDARCSDSGHNWQCLHDRYICRSLYRGAFPAVWPLNPAPWE